MSDMIRDRSWVEINLDNFSHNIAELKRLLLPGQEFMQIVKADAYGHGGFEIAKTALAEGAVYLGVANSEEGRTLRLQGIKAPILILSPSLKDEIPSILDNGLTATLSELSFAQALSEEAGKRKLTAKVHLKVDTGMHRSGFLLENAVSAYQTIKGLSSLNLEGVFSHFAASENDAEFSEEQTRLFEAFLNEIKPLPPYVHLANSSALLRHNLWQANLVRLGILSYGAYLDSSQYEKLNLKSVMTFKSTVVQTKTLKKGDFVGYNNTWQADRDGRYGIVPVGYADGYDFLLSNCGSAIVRGQVCPVIGKVSMDMITLDLTATGEVMEGDEVILMGGNSNLLRVNQLTSKYNGSPYELLCQVGRRAKRYYFLAGRMISSAPLSRREFVSTDYSDSKLNRIISAAISQRLQNQEISQLVYHEVLKGIFYQKDHNIHYRSGFCHEITFTEESVEQGFYLTETKLTYYKNLQSDYFLVACANSEDVLKKYFLRRDVEYRWLMDSNFALTPEQFCITCVKINDIVLHTKSQRKDGCLEIFCTNPDLAGLIGTKVKFTIETVTFYPKSSHQLSVFISELTQGIDIRFNFPQSIKDVEAITVFSGQNRYPQVKKGQNYVAVQTNPEEWVFPNSGVVFAY